MLLIPRKRIWTQQPQGASQINRSNPLAETITNCIPFNGVDSDIVTGQRLTTTNGTKAIDSRGRSIRSAGASSCASIPLNLSAYKKVTISWWMFWDTFATDDKFAFELTPNTNTNVGGILIDPNSSTGRFSVYTLMESGSGRGRDFTRPSGGQWHHYMTTIDRTVAAASGNVSRLWIDGVEQSFTELYPAAPGANNFANSTLYIFSRNNASLFGAGRIQNLVFRGGYLATSKDALDEFNNPWQIFRTPDSRIFVPTSAVAGGGDSLIASSLIASPATVGIPLLSQKHALSASSITTAPAIVASPAITQRHALSATAVSVSPAVIGNPTIGQSHALTVSVITAASSIGTPSIAQRHGLTVANIVAPATVAHPVITQSHALTATAISASATVGDPTLTEITAGVLSALPITAQPAVVGAPAIGQSHALSAGAISAGPATFGTPTLAQQHAIMAQGIAAGPAVVGSPVLGFPPEGGDVQYPLAGLIQSRPLAGMSQTYPLGN